MSVNIPEYEVTQFNKIFKEVVENNFDYIRIRGEISELKIAASGHIYLTLKDSTSILNATIWNQKKEYLNIKPEIGMEIIATGKISTYAKSISTYSINIDKIEIAGEGALLKLIEDRKSRLEKKGIFELKHKKKLPFLPDKIGVITSPTGSVIYDIINKIKDRYPVDIDIWPVTVQGANAADKIINAIQNFNKLNFIDKPDVIIIARGGGSTEDLMPFNDEGLAYAVYQSKIPIISAIGHETDTTIIDYVSDLRASTPTAAAEKAVPIKLELINLVTSTSRRLNSYVYNQYNKKNIELSHLSKFLKSPDIIINSYKDKFRFLLNNLSNKIDTAYKADKNKLDNYKKLIKSPEDKINILINDLTFISKNLNKSIDNKYFEKKKEINKFSRLLISNSLYKNLEKGYSVIRKSKKIINKSSLINNEDTINIQFQDKSINFKIKKFN